MKKKIDRLDSGMIIAFCTMSIIQDCYGLEGYIEHLRNSWISAGYTLPLAIIVLVLTIWNIKEPDDKK